MSTWKILCKYKPQRPRYSH